MRQVEPAGLGCGYASDRPAAKLLDEDRIAPAPGVDQLALWRKAVNPVLSVAIRDEDVAVRGLDRAGGHVERLARGTRLAWRPERQQHFTGWRVTGDRVQAGIRDEDLV